MQKGVEFDLSKRYENIPVSVFASAEKGATYIAEYIKAVIQAKQAIGDSCVIGIATGSSQVGVFKELIRMHHEEKLSFANVYIIVPDEYSPMNQDNVNSHYYFINERLVKQIDLPEGHFIIPEGQMDGKDVVQYCKEFEQKIADLGGIDVQLLGIGRTGHIGFNEPGSSFHSRTRLVALDNYTITDAASVFYGEENVPKNAITLGIATIMSAKRIFLLAWGEGKASIINKAVEGAHSEMLPASRLQQHVDVEVVVDEAAAAELTRFKTPWLVTTCQWNNRLIRKAVVWLCFKLQKPILKLTDRDYTDNGMSNLITEFGSSNKINIQVFNDLQHTITGWPGGKPNADDFHRPERAMPFPKRVIIFSPHPDDDVISMGGTMIRLVDQQHDVHVAYQTSGNIAVFDDDVVRFVDFVRELAEEFDYNKEQMNSFYARVEKFVSKKKPDQVDSNEVQTLKAIIRRGEARAACRYVGLPENRMHFLKLPFYETGSVKKKSLSQADVEVIKSLLQEVQPHQIYAAGDLSDPHGTHRVCLDVIFMALEELKNEAWMKDCYVWLYRGAWQEWDINDVDMAVPLSPDELLKKRRAIFKHQSQKDRPLFPGHDTREFWQRAEARNRDTAIKYDKLGMAEYEAMELFVRYR